MPLVFASLASRGDMGSLAEPGWPNSGFRQIWRGSSRTSLVFYS
jgi:hypothetical protein